MNETISNFRFRLLLGRMNRRVNKGGRKSPLVVREIIPPANDESAVLRRSQRQNPHPVSFPGDLTGGRREHVEPVVIGNHQVKSVGNLNILKKKPLENYFGGTKQKKLAKRRMKLSVRNQNLNNFAKDVEQSDPNGAHHLEGVETPKMCTHSSIQIIPTEEEVIRKHLEYKIYECIKAKEYNDRKCQQKEKEENYIKEQEQLAETWMKYIKKSNKTCQLRSDGGVCQRNSSDRGEKVYKSRYFFRSKKFSDGQDKEKEGKESNESVRSESSFDELGSVFEKLGPVSEESSG